MAITRWNPARDLVGIAEEMNRLIGNIFDDSSVATSIFRSEWSPAVDISEDKDNFYLHIELPGLNKDDVKISYEENILTVKGEKKSTTEEKSLNRHRTERFFGAFQRSFRVPSRIVANKIEAKFENGILAITLPKAEEVKSREIEVKIS